MLHKFILWIKKINQKPERKPECWLCDWWDDELGCLDLGKLLGCPYPHPDKVEKAKKLYEMKGESND